LILDEATSALDRETQSEISSSLRELKRKVTLVTIAHRLESIQHTDRVINILGPNQIEIAGTNTFLSSIKVDSNEIN
jgi:ABC-type bacteriocin/lantibiotic exporter with double-glycine peptidase domain